jgi:hypothetical protein
MYNRPMCGRSTGTYKNLGDLQRDLRGLSPTPPNKKTYRFGVFCTEDRAVDVAYDPCGKQGYILCTIAMQDSAIDMVESLWNTRLYVW